MKHSNILSKLEEMIPNTLSIISISAVDNLTITEDSDYLIDKEKVAVGDYGVISLRVLIPIT